MKPGSHVEQRDDAPSHPDPAGGGPQHTRDRLEQRALAGAIAPDDPDDLTTPDLQAHAAQRPERRLDRLAPQTTNDVLLERSCVPTRSPILDAHVLNADADLL